MVRTLGLMLTHTYTRSTVTGGDEDAWGDEAAMPGAGTSGLRCLYGSEVRLLRDQSVRDEYGSRTIKVPTLFVPPDDPLAVGDVVTNVLDASGTVVQAGPFVVESVNMNAELGVSVLKACELRTTTARVDS
jgi:hypothetical protein